MSVTVAESEQLDTLGGWNPDPELATFPCGSCWGSEGRFLYRQVRDLKPRIVVEVGRWAGASASHIALALKDNGFGRLYSIDINESMGDMIPDNLRTWITFVNVDALTYEWPKDLPIDLLLEDGMHSPGFTSTILRNYKAKTVIVHDFKHVTVGPVVAAESREVLGEPDEIFFEPPADCGYGLWRLDN